MKVKELRIISLELLDEKIIPNIINIQYLEEDKIYIVYYKETKTMKQELEILKLKHMLDDANIPYEFTDDYFKGNHKPSYQIVINNKNGGILCDVIYHFGSYGYQNNKLEIKGGLTLEEENKEGSVLGYLTADEVFKRFKYCYEHNTKYYKE